MNGYRHLLVALDFGPEQPQLLDKASQLAKQHQADLTLLHVVEYLGPAFAGDMPLPDDFEVDQLLVERAREELTRVAASLAPLAVDSRVEQGVPKHEITRVAKELGVDLILVGSHGRHGLQLLLGSTANGVLHLSDCDVLAVRVHAPAAD